eukprot:scaffold93038_cov38-Prasinocladus_malaysianus.AAC.1
MTGRFRKGRSMLRSSTIDHCTSLRKLGCSSSDRGVWGVLGALRVAWDDTDDFLRMSMLEPRVNTDSLRGGSSTASVPSLLPSIGGGDSHDAPLAGRLCASSTANELCCSSSSADRLSKSVPGSSLATECCR